VKAYSLLCVGSNPITNPTISISVNSAQPIIEFKPYDTEDAQSHFQIFANPPA
jgi:hypothetical protein